MTNSFRPPNPTHLRVLCVTFAPSAFKVANQPCLHSSSNPVPPANSRGTDTVRYRFKMLEEIFPPRD